MEALSWLAFSIKDILDILLVAFFLYYIYQILKTSGSKALFLGIVTFVILWILVSQVFGMRLMGRILDKFVSFGFLVIVIIFQDEVRKLLATIGSSQRWRFLTRLISSEKRKAKAEGTKYIAPIVLACMNLARKKTGALIAIEGEIPLTAYMYTGETFKADVNARLLENIFFKNSPLHDGAMIISKGSICAAGCILPVSSGELSNKDLGLRHRSALGLSKETDSLVIIISEERGKISIAHKGSLSVDIDADELQRKLESFCEAIT